MTSQVAIEGGFAEVAAGAWLMGRGQPAAFFGRAVRRRRAGWRVRDRSALDLVETTAAAKCADASRPFLTHIPCAAPVFAVSGKVLVAPAAARKDAHLVKVVPMSAKRALCVTEFAQFDAEQPPNHPTTQPPNHLTTQPPNHLTTQPPNQSAWVVMATASRTCRMPLEDGQTLSVRPEAVVAWTGKMPTGFCPKLSIWDVILPRGPRDLLFTFYGPGVVWAEGSSHQATSLTGRQTNSRRAYGV